MVFTRVLAKSASANTLEGIYGVCRFLVNDLTGSTGPAWNLVECDDTFIRSEPSASFAPNSTFQDITASNLWSTQNPGVPITGSWCVLESIDANNENHFQLYVRLTALDQADFRLLYFEDFVSSGSLSAQSTLGAEPEFPATGTIPHITASTTMAGYTTAGTYSCVADEGMCSIIIDNGSTPRWLYAGEMDPFHSGAGDTRCYVINHDTAQVYWDDVGSFVDEDWSRVSPLDDVTILNRGEGLHIANSAETVRFGGNRGNLLGSDVVWIVGIVFDDSGHQHHVGWLRNVFAVNNALGTEGTLGLTGSPNFYFRASSVSSARGPVCWTWDGSTVV